MLIRFSSFADFFAKYLVICPAFISPSCILGVRNSVHGIGEFLALGKKNALFTQRLLCILAYAQDSVHTEEHLEIIKTVIKIFLDFNRAISKFSGLS